MRPRATAATWATVGKTRRLTSSPKKTWTVWSATTPLVTTKNHRAWPGTWSPKTPNSHRLRQDSSSGIDLSKIAKKVGKSSRDTCGACHFNGGGGDGVKHGDLDSSLGAPQRAGCAHGCLWQLDFTCGTCHKTSSHDVAGSRYAPTAKDAKGAHLRGKAETTATLQPASLVPWQWPPQGSQARLNTHTNKLACQTCHIPAYARGGHRHQDDLGLVHRRQRDAKGKHMCARMKTATITYESRIKGDFTWKENVKPEYVVQRRGELHLDGRQDRSRVTSPPRSTALKAAPPMASP
jgi:hypothetical protein